MFYSIVFYIAFAFCFLLSFILATNQHDAAFIGGEQSTKWIKYEKLRREGTTAWNEWHWTSIEKSWNEMWNWEISWIHLFYTLELEQWFDVQ